MPRDGDAAEASGEPVIEIVDEQRERVCVVSGVVPAEHAYRVVMGRARSW
jgi:hypothetical protein